MTTVGKYRFDHRLGGGGMAEVFIGSTVGAEGFSRKVAIKRVLPGFSDNPAFAQMFVAEARISSRLQHPNIVSVLDFDRDPEGRLFLVMELVEGRDLDTLVASGPLPFPVIIYTIAEVLRGLGYAHDLPVTGDVGAGDTISGMRGIVHRDVSPHNVLLSWEGAVKVSDFGIAKARAASEATASVFIKGKPAYMSPEQANGQPLDGRSDLFAVGVMLWEMLCGRRLFVGEDTRSTLAAVLFGQIPRPRSLRPDVPKDLERVVMKLLERDLPARYATAELAIADL
ncbi:MAG: serine/threonine-protein kinase, partial [Acidobacteriota bacterium]